MGEDLSGNQGTGDEDEAVTITMMTKDITKKRNLLLGTKKNLDIRRGTMETGREVEGNLLQAMLAKQYQKTKRSTIANGRNSWRRY